jgi:hypothetical protein
VAASRKASADASTSTFPFMVNLRSKVPDALVIPIACVRPMSAA